MNVLGNIVGVSLAIKVGLIALILGLGGGAFTAYHYTDKIEQASFQKKLQTQQVEAETLLLKTTQAAEKRDKENTQITQQLEKDYDSAQQAVAIQRSTNSNLSSKLGGLRDPYARKSGCGTLPSNTIATSGIINDAPTGQLSAEASQFLLDFAYQCDVAASYADSAHAWAISDSFNH